MGGREASLHKIGRGVGDEEALRSVGRVRLLVRAGVRLRLRLRLRLRRSVRVRRGCG